MRCYIQWVCGFIFLSLSAFGQENSWGVVDMVHASNGGAIFPSRADSGVLAELSDLSKERPLADFSYDFSLLPADDPVPRSCFTRYRFAFPPNQNQKVLNLTFDRLTPSAEYRVNVYALESYYTGDSRQYQLVWNGVLQDQILAPWRDAGAQFKPVRYSFQGQADENGKILVSFQWVKDNPLYNAFTVEGTHLPSVSTLSVQRLSSSGISLEWTETTDTLCYVLQRKEADAGIWETVTNLVRTSSFEDRSALHGISYQYRIVSSNALGTAVSEPVEALPLRPRYAVNVGGAEHPVGRFIPMGPFTTNSLEVRADTFTLKKDLAEMAGSMEVYKTRAIDMDGETRGMQFVFPDLSPETEYRIRIHTIEPYGWYTDAGHRSLSISVNGTVVADSILSGSLYMPTFSDCFGSSDSNGVINLKITSVNDNAVVCGVEIFEPAETPLAAPKPLLFPSLEGIRLSMNSGSDAFLYDIEYKDKEGDAPKVLYSKVSGYVLYDFTVPAGVTRFYRVKAFDGTAESEWSDWVSAARSTESRFSTIQVNCSGSGTLVDGWTPDGLYRVTEGEFLGSTRTQAVSFEHVTDPAPQLVYQSYLYLRVPEGTRGCYSYQIPNLDPATPYRLRLHLAELWDAATVKTRIFKVAVNRGVPQEWKGLDVFQLAGGAYKAWIEERTVYPDQFGRLDLRFISIANNASVCGFELIPQGEAQLGTGFSSLIRSAWGTEAEKTEVQTVKQELRWSEEDVPAACADTNLTVLSQGKFFAPVDANYQFVFKGRSGVTLWVDGELVLNNEVSSSVLTNRSETVALAIGEHSFYVQLTRPAGSPLAAELQWEMNGTACEVAPYLYSGTGLLDSGDWKLRVQGTGQLPSYALPLNADLSAFRLVGSGGDLWGGTDHGAFLYQKVDGSFDLLMRYTSFGGQYSIQTRFGIEVRGGLGSTAKDGFVLFGGVQQRESTRVIGFADTNLVDGLNIVTWGSPEMVSFLKLPFWVKFSRRPGGVGEHVYRYSFSTNGVLFEKERSVTLPYRREVYVGPLVMTHYASGHQPTPFMEFDSFQIIDKTQRGTLLLLR